MPPGAISIKGCQKGVVAQHIAVVLTFTTDFRDMDRKGYENGYYIGGTLIDGVTPDMTIWKEGSSGCRALLDACRSREPAMTLNFPNPTRSFEEMRNAVCFVGHDGIFEIRFFVEAGALAHSGQWGEEVLDKWVEC